MTLQELLTRSEEISDWLDQNTHSLEIEASDRLRLSGACFDQVQEHARATYLLLRHGLTGSAFSLVRVTFETSYRGLWLRHCATDQELADFQKKDELPKQTPIIKAVESIDAYNAGVLSRLSKDYWSAMCSYAHGGYLPTVRRITSRGIEPNYSDEEIKQVILFASVWALAAGLEIFDMGGRVDLCEAVLTRIESLPSLSQPNYGAKIDQ
jgi:hypothetical protein